MSQAEPDAAAVAESAGTVLSPLPPSSQPSAATLSSPPRLLLLSSGVSLPRHIKLHGRRAASLGGASIDAAISLTPSTSAPGPASAPLDVTCSGAAAHSGQSVQSSAYASGSNAASSSPASASSPSASSPPPVTQLHARSHSSPVAGDGRAERGALNALSPFATRRLPLGLRIHPSPSSARLGTPLSPPPLPPAVAAVAVAQPAPADATPAADESAAASPSVVTAAASDAAPPLPPAVPPAAQPDSFDAESAASHPAELSPAPAASPARTSSTRPSRLPLRVHPSPVSRTDGVGGEDGSGEPINGRKRQSRRRSVSPARDSTPERKRASSPAASRIRSSKQPYSPRATVTSPAPPSPLSPRSTSSSCRSSSGNGGGFVPRVAALKPPLQQRPSGSDKQQPSSKVPRSPTSRSKLLPPPKLPRVATRSSDEPASDTCFSNQSAELEDSFMNELALSDTEAPVSSDEEELEEEWQEEASESDTPLEEEEENSVPNRRPLDVLDALFEDPSAGEEEESIGELQRRERRRIERMKADEMQREATASAALAAILAALPSSSSSANGALPARNLPTRIALRSTLRAKPMGAPVLQPAVAAVSVSSSATATHSPAALDASIVCPSNVTQTTAIDAVSEASSSLLWTVPTPFDPSFLSTHFDASQHDLYFAYGSNMRAARMQARRVQMVGGRGMSARLQGFRLVFDKLSESLGAESTRRGAIGYANLVPASAPAIDAAAYGVLYIVPRPAGLAQLDVYEGVSAGMYARHSVQVQLQDGRFVTATTYLACAASCAPQSDWLAPTKTYLSHLLDGCDHLPEAYHRALAATSLSWMPDPAALVDAAISLEVSEPLDKYGSTTISSVRVAEARTASPTRTHTLSASMMEAEGDLESPFSSPAASRTVSSSGSTGEETEAERSVSDASTSHAVNAQVQNAAKQTAGIGVESAAADASPSESAVGDAEAASVQSADSKPSSTAAAAATALPRVSFPRHISFRPAKRR